MRRTKVIEAPEGHTRECAPEPPSPEDDDDERMVDGLERLARLHASGDLSDDEYAVAKGCLLRGDEVADADEAAEYAPEYETPFLRWAPWWMVGVVIGGTVLALLTLGAVDPFFSAVAAWRTVVGVMWGATVLFVYFDGRARDADGEPFLAREFFAAVILGGWAYLLGRAYYRKGTWGAHGDHWLAPPLLLALQVIVLSQALAITNITASHDAVVTPAAARAAFSQAASPSRGRSPGSGTTPAQSSSSQAPSFVVRPLLPPDSLITGHNPPGMRNCTPGELTAAAVAQAGGNAYVPVSAAACAWGWAVGLAGGHANLFRWTHTGWQTVAAGTDGQMQSFGASMGAPAVFVGALESQATWCPDLVPNC